MTDKQPKNQHESDPKEQTQKSWFRRNALNIALFAGIAGYLTMSFNDSADNQPVSLDIMTSGEYIAALHDNDIKSAKIEQIDGKYIVTGTLNVNDYKKPNPEDEGKELSEKELAQGPVYKVNLGEQNPEAMLSAKGVPVQTVEHDPYKRPSAEILTIDDVEMLLDNGQVTGISYSKVYGGDVQFNGSYMPVKGYDDYQVQFASSELGEYADQVVAKIDESDVKRVHQAVEKPSGFMSMLPFLIFPAIFIGYIVWQMRVMRGAGGGVVGRKPHNHINPDDITEGFDDVQGVDHAKSQLKQMVQYLKDPQALVEMGGRPPKGALLSGPPGTGKTMLAKAVAKEAGVPFFSMSGSDFVEVYVGVGAQRARKLFEEARENAPCIIFVDEIDAIGGNRGGQMTHGHSEQQQTLTQILTAMDGFDAGSGVVVLAATNRPESLDPALTRPGRFDRKIEVNVPDLSGRVAILTKYITEKACAKDVSIEDLARATPGFSGADLANLANEAVILAHAAGRKEADMMDFITARDNIVFGEAKKLSITEDEQRLTCDHEAGHALVMKLTPGSAPILKATATPRAKTLGMVETAYEGDKVSYNKQQLLALMDAFMAGRIAEEIFHGEDAVTTGASNDIEQATKIARQMILDWGWSKYGMQKFTEEQRATFLSQGSSSLMDISDEKKQALEAEIDDLLKQSHDRAYKIIDENKDKLQLISEALFHYETITGAEIDGLLRGEAIQRRPTDKPGLGLPASPSNDNQDNNKRGPQAGPKMNMG